MSELSDEEHHIIIGAIRCLHHLYYMGEIANMMKQNNELMAQMIEELVKIKEKMG